MRKKKTNHAVFSFVWPGTLCCFHCGDTYKVSLPCSLEIAHAITKAFGKEHKGCKESERGRGLRKEHESDYEKYKKKEEGKDDPVSDQTSG